MFYSNVSQLKAKLSEHLRRVEAGEVLVVLDRKRPVAKIVPADDPSGDVRITESTGGPAALREIKPVRVGGQVDVDALLRQLRGER